MDVRVFRCRRVYLPSLDREVGVLTEIVAGDDHYRELAMLGRDFDWGGSTAGARALAVSILARVSPDTAEAQATWFVLEVLSQIRDRAWELAGEAIDRWCRGDLDSAGVLHSVVVLPTSVDTAQHLAAVASAIEQQTRRRHVASMFSRNLSDAVRMDCAGRAAVHRGLDRVGGLGRVDGDPRDGGVGR